MRKKLKCNRGETLIEAMISLLIAVLSMGLVATAAIAAAKMNQENKQVDDAFAEELEKVEGYATNKEIKQMTIVFEDGSRKTVNVYLYGEESRFACYKK